MGRNGIVRLSTMLFFCFGEKYEKIFENFPYNSKVKLFGTPQGGGVYVCQNPPKNIQGKILTGRKVNLGAYQFTIR